MNNLKKLILSFTNYFGKERTKELLSYVDHNESALALEILSDWIYEEDIEVSKEQEKQFIDLSPKVGIEKSYHAFIDRNPPYPDLRKN